MEVCEQMCNKQCRDENGFKCHQMSESHLQQMKVFGANPHRVIDGYSDMFLDTFVEHLKLACVPPRGKPPAMMREEADRRETQTLPPPCRAGHWTRGWLLSSLDGGSGGPSLCLTTRRWVGLHLPPRRHRHTRMAAVVVYNEYINDKHHVHMNGT